MVRIYSILRSAFIQELYNFNEINDFSRIPFLKFLLQLLRILAGLLLKVQDSHQQFLLTGYFIYTQAQAQADY